MNIQYINAITPARIKYENVMRKLESEDREFSPEANKAESEFLEVVKNARKYLV